MDKHATTETKAPHDGAPAAALPHTTGTQVPHGEGHQKTFPPLDPTTFAPQLIWLAITFSVLYVLLSRVVLPRLSEIIEERADRIRRDIESAERLKNETEKAQATYEQALADARANASAIAQQTRDKLAAEVDAERAKIEQQINEKVAQAEAKLSETKAAALASVDEIAAETASAAIDKLIGQSVSADEVRAALKSMNRG